MKSHKHIIPVDKTNDAYKSKMKEVKTKY